MIDRVNGPKINDQFDIRLPNLEQLVLDNGLPVFHLNGSPQKIVKIDLCIQCGRKNETKKAVAKATVKALNKGSEHYSFQEISEIFDFYGAEYGSRLGLDHIKFTLTTLKDHLEEVLKVWSDLLLRPTFPEDELRRYLSISKQNLTMQLYKNDVIAYRQFTEKLFGSLHPYGYNTMPEDVDLVTQSDIKAYYNQMISEHNAALFISGNIDNEVLTTVKKYFSSYPYSYKKENEEEIETVAPATGSYRIKAGQDQQVSVIIGKKAMDRRHPDFAGLFVLNTILGGYFGSRLNLNIRENKGYCYNIYSMLDCLAHDGYWYISADVSKENVDLTIKEIKTELHKLQTETLDNTELSMVKNYLQGHLLGMLDGPFVTSKMFQDTWKYNLPLDAFELFIDKIKEIKAEELQELAIKYFDINQLTEVMVGGQI